MTPRRIPFLKPDGHPQIEIVVGVSEADRKARLAIGQPLAKALDTNPVGALIDTGSTRTFVPEDFVHRLGIGPVGVAEVRQPLTGLTMVELFPVSINMMRNRLLGNGWEEIRLVPDLLVGVLPENQDGATRRHAMPIVGRDVLSRCRFLYDGPQQCVDFYTERDLKGRGWWPFGR